MSNKRKTFKMRARKTDLRQRNVAKSEMRKRVGGRQRTHNRYDEHDNGSRPLQEIVNDITDAVAIPSQEFDLDPRSLTNLLLRPAAPAQADSSAKSTSSSSSTQGKSPTATSATSKKQASRTSSATAPARPLAAAKVLPVGPLAMDDPVALPDVRALEEEEHRRRDAEAAARLGNENKNQYRHHGQAYLFWERVDLHPRLLQALRAMKFSHPTPVQQEVLPSVLEDQKTEWAREHQFIRQQQQAAKRGEAAPTSIRRKRGKDGPKDVVVSAETGSGKTLVFALPILNDILATLQAEGRLPVDSPTPPAAVPTDKAEAATEDTTESAAATSATGQKRARSASSWAQGGSEEPATKRAGKESADANKAKGKGVKAVPVVSAAGSSLSSSASAVPKLAKADFDRQLMHTLIVSPTRELALQINDAMRQLTKFAPEVTIGCIVGGMAAEKQQRVLNRHPHVLICTPGRLWELAKQNEGCYLGHSISRRLRYVVLDEADKLLQSGRFEQLQEMLARIHNDVLPAGFEQSREEGAEVGETEVVTGRWDPIAGKFVPFTAEELAARDGGRGGGGGGGTAPAKAPTRSRKTAKAEEEEEEAEAEDEYEEGNDEEEELDDDEEELDDDEEEEDEEEEMDEEMPEVRRRATPKKDQPHPIPMPPAPREDHRVRTMVTSATLSLQTNYERKDFKSNKSIIRTSNADTMNKVLQELDLKPQSTHVFSMSENATVVAKINETYLRCPEDSKDLYLYYFLKTYPGERTIIFVNAISMLRRLVKILEILGIAVVGLHASMQQRQRLKFVDKFKAGTVQVLVATDIASRGLDIEGLKYVVHFQVPRTTDAYIHRCGRTARCGGTGLSLLMVSAQEYVSFKKLMESLGRPEKSMETFALQPIVVHQLHAHLRIALQIDKLQREISKSRASNGWVTRMSKAADLEVDDMFDDEADNVNREKLRAIKILSRELSLMVKKFTGGFGGKGAFRTGAQALGAREAEEKLRQRANVQTLKVAKQVVAATPKDSKSVKKRSKPLKPKESAKPMKLKESTKPMKTKESSKTVKAKKSVK